MLRTVHLHGGLHPDPIHIHGDTVADIIDGLSRQLVCLKPDPTLGRRVLQVKGVDTEDDLHKFLGMQLDVHVYPVLEGEKGKFSQILVGATLIALSFVPGLQGVAFAGASLARNLAQVGMLMLLGGVAQLLSPVPEISSEDDRQSRLVTTGKNTVAIGTRIPVLYGEWRAGGHYLSVNINAKKSDGGD